MDASIFFFFLFAAAFLPLPTSSGPVAVHSITPNFTASNSKFIDYGGAFLVSLNASFKATITNSKSPLHLHHYYLSVVHVSSSTVVWSANRDAPMSQSSLLSLTPHGGLRIITNDSSSNTTNQLLWSTPNLTSRVSSLQLLETGNLVLLDDKNVTVWQSFDYPTDTVVLGQRLRVGKTRVSSKSPDDISSGDYRLTVTNEDVVLQWKKTTTYWKLSSDVKAFKDSNSGVSFLELNNTGLFVFGGNGTSSAFDIILGASVDFRIMKLGDGGRLSISRFVRSNTSVEEFSAPFQHCQVPLVCGKLGLCSGATNSVPYNCACQPGFYAKLHPAGSDCVPNNSSLSLPSPCKTNNGTYSSVSYVQLSNDTIYFANDFMNPLNRNITLSVCQYLCSQNCSCLAIFHEASSGSCYMIENELGSLTRSSPGTKNERLGYIKTLVVVGVASSSVVNGNDNNRLSFPVAGFVLIPFSGLILILAAVLLTTLWLRRKKTFGPSKISKLERWDSSSSSDSEDISIPGLPVRYDYEELEAATENFKTQIGSGGFGTVYKGTLADKTVVAVKKMTNLGVQGKKEFFTEVSIIANIHHINLVCLKGFCVQGNKRFLVFEFMNKGSLDRVLFGNGNGTSPALQWRERFEIALGTARGLAYLHNGCNHKIIHCDVKPENILLNGNLQIKISDFGLSKLLNPEQSGFFTTMRGTRGYLAPEWLTNTAITDKVDVYGYGMVLLEIVRGKKNYSTSLVPSERYFPLVALEMHEQKRYLELVDPRLEGKVPSEEVEKLIKIGLCCVQEDPALRPSMAGVVGMLEGAVALAEPRLQSLNFLRYYGKRLGESTETFSSVETGNKNDLGFWKNDSASSYISTEELSGPR